VRSGQPPQRFEAVAALAPVTPPRASSLLPRGAVAVLAQDPSLVKTEAPVAAAAPLPACTSEPPTPQCAWQPEDGRVWSYAQVRQSRQRSWTTQGDKLPIGRSHCVSCSVGRYVCCDVPGTISCTRTEVTNPNPAGNHSARGLEEV